LYLCSKEIIKKYTPLLKELNLTYTQYIVMMYFWENKSCNVGELGKSLLLESNTLTPLLKKLESKGYITRNKSKTDERKVELSITSKGESLKQKAKDIPMTMGKCVNLSEEDSKILYSLLYKILANLKHSGDMSRTFLDDF